MKYKLKKKELAKIAKKYVKNEFKNMKKKYNFAEISLVNFISYEISTIL